MKLFNSLSLTPGRVGTSAAALAAILGMALPAITSAAPTARISASRTSGPAPLAVFFDATATTDTAVDPFRQLGYRFVFGDSSAGNWSTTGLSKNQQIGGPIAAHVFEQPGTYTVEVTAKDANGATSVANVTINVQSPDSAFSGTSTVCISRTSDFAGCPAGAQHIANAGSWPGFQSGHRYLLHRGQDFSGLGSVNFGAGGNGLSDAQISAFGTGSKPIVGNLTVLTGNTPGSTWHHRVVVMDLDARGITQDTAGSDLLVFRNTVNRGGMIDIASAFGWMLANSVISGWRNPENIFVVENFVDRNYDTTVNSNPNGIAGNAVRFAVMGNTIDRTREHNMRIWQAHKLFVAHNSATGRAGDMSRGTLKIHSSGLGSVLSTLLSGGGNNQRSSYLVIADNRLGSAESNIQWLAGTSPQNAEEPEGLEHVIWEDNQFRHGANFAADMTWLGRNMTQRGDRNMTDNRSVSFGNARSDVLPSDWIGPYYPGQASMKPRFQGATDVRPASPTALRAE